jgi:hypothetical protein
MNLENLMLKSLNVSVSILYEKKNENKIIYWIIYILDISVMIECIK